MLGPTVSAGNLSFEEGPEKNTDYNMMPGNFFRILCHGFFGEHTIFALMLGRVKGSIGSLGDRGGGIRFL